MCCCTGGGDFDVDRYSFWTLKVIIDFQMGVLSFIIFYE